MIFVDIWAWIALASRRDQHHAAASFYRRARAIRRFVTSTFVLDETITELYRTIGSARAETFVSAIFASLATGSYQLIDVTIERLNAAWDLRRRYADKPDISFTDLTSAAIMQELGISEVFTGDQHFAQLNLGFTLLPGANP